MRIALLALIVAIAGAPQGAPDGKVVYVGHEKVAQGGSLVTAPNLLISVNRRAATGESEVHDKETDTLHILSGSATFVVGGEMIGSRQTAPGQYRGTGVRGGETFQLTPGDVIVIPAGIPHWFKDVPGPIEYYVVKVLKP